jgi:hypothetical protein
LAPARQSSENTEDPGALRPVYAANRGQPMGKVTRLGMQIVCAAAMNISELNMTLHIQARVEDFRNDRSTPLPQAQFLPFNLQ